MDTLELLVYVRAFFSDARVLTILGLILLDVVLAIAAAIKAGVFEWGRLGEFYRTMVLPYLLGYLAFYLAAKLIATEWMGGYAYLVGETVIMIAWLALVANLVADVLRSAKALGYGFPEGDA